MKFKGLAILTVACLAIGMLGYDASADGHLGNCRSPASALLFPFWDQTGGTVITVMTITNTCVNMDDIYVRLVWVDENFCTPEDQWIELTCGDTYSFVDSAQNPEPGARGFMYAYVVSGFGSTAEIDFDYLIGQEMVLTTAGNPALIASFAVNAVAFQALAPDGDGILKLDGTEFSAAPSEIYFPRFFGVVPGLFDGSIIMINLTGGQWFWQQANVLVYNDNEQSFSTTVYFPCWAYFTLSQVSATTSETFLKTTNHDLQELWGVGTFLNGKETGWIYFQGDWAWNPQTTFTIDNPSLYAVLVESIAGVVSGADLPWSIIDTAVYNNASLWPTSPWGQ